jgi:hypothetical protein
METQPEISITVDVNVFISPKHLKEIKLKFKILQKDNKYTLEKNFYQLNTLISQLSKKFYFSDEIIPKPKKIENSDELKIEIEKFLNFICCQNEIAQNFDFLNFFEEGNASETTPISSLTSEDGFLLSESAVTFKSTMLGVDDVSRSYKESKTGSLFLNTIRRRQSLPLLEVEQNKQM